MACSGMAFERDPLPDAASWRGIENRCERLRAGLNAIYAWYERNEELTACVLRDSEVHALTKEIMQLRFRPYWSAYHEVLGTKLTAKQRAMLALALSFHTWRTLARESGLKRNAAAAAMVQAIESAEAL